MVINCYQSNGSIEFFITIAHHRLKEPTNVFKLYMLYIETPANLVLNLTNGIFNIKCDSKQICWRKKD